MGKVKNKYSDKTKVEGPSPNTLFVSNLPYSFTNSKLEEVFSDVGPIRRCFLVAPKGSNENRGFGFVQFAIKEDADRAIDLKNNSSIEGRPISVKHALHRPPLDQRRSKKTKETTTDSGGNGNVDSRKKNGAISKKTNGLGEVRKTIKPSQVIGDSNDKENFSSKQRIARTVIFGCLSSDEIAEEVCRKSGEIGSVCSYTYPLPEDILEQFGLGQEGCNPKASAALYSSVKEARLCVRTLHQKEVNGGIIWARQLGGEGSKTQKWKLIIRNLPFKVKAGELKDLFSGAGFVWDVFVPCDNDTGDSKGFAFVKFTSKNDAEKAIQKFNKHTFGKRPIAVDWAIPKKVYSSICNDSVSHKEEPDPDVASEDDDDSDNEKESQNDIKQSPTAECEKPSEKVLPEVDFGKEAEIARKVLNNFINHTSKEDSTPKQNKEEKIVDSEPKENPTYVKQPKEVPSNIPSTKTTSSIKEQDEDLSGTVFLSNLPFDVETDEVKQKFSAFGEVLSFYPVLHQVTKRPRGTGFLKFKTEDSAVQAVSAANTASGLGVFLKGRQLKVMKALDKKSAHGKVLEKAQNENQDHRNLSLAKEGSILEGTPAAVGVSAGDMTKRKRLMEKKMQKLKSPNFHVSKTRLIVYNIPSGVTEEELKKLFINAVVSRATKQKPVIKQLKFLRSMKNGKVVSKDRVVAFVEFTEHQHALVALRVLNNNPETFGPERRPIIDFALDNVQTLKRRNEKMKAEKERQNAEVDDRKPKPMPNKRKYERESEGKRSAIGEMGNKRRKVEPKFGNKKRKGSKGLSNIEYAERRVKDKERNADLKAKDVSVSVHLDKLVEHYRAKFSKTI